MAGTYSKAYQLSMVREDEAIAFYGKNKIATPARVSVITNTSAQQQPTIVTDHMQNENMGKTRPASSLTLTSTAQNKSAYGTVPMTVS
jgi:hypothetical protein